jgi:hypothetical protein
MKFYNVKNDSYKNIDIFILIVNLLHYYDSYGVC